MQQNRNLNSVPKLETRFKNEASLKSLISKGYFLLFGMAACSLYFYRQNNEVSSSVIFILKWHI